VLLGLRGVGVAVASVILHFGEPARHPIYDVRVRAALRRAGVRRRFSPTPAGWAAYAATLRALARRRRVSLRTLDKALWRLGGRDAERGRRRATGAPIGRVLPCRCRGDAGGNGRRHPFRSRRTLTAAEPRGDPWRFSTSSRATW
jgi:hypothetical protein